MWLNPQFPADLVTFTEEILSGKLYFLCSVFEEGPDEDPGLFMIECNQRLVNLSLSKCRIAFWNCSHMYMMNRNFCLIRFTISRGNVRPYFHCCVELGLIVGGDGHSYHSGTNNRLRGIWDWLWFSCGVRTAGEV